jgi:hypothetical protein
VRSQSFLILGVGFLGLASLASAGVITGAAGPPVSSCANNVGDSGFTCNFFETSGGAPSDHSDVVSFPTVPTVQSVNAGYVVLLESPGGSHTDPTQWSDVLQFIDNGGGVSTSAQLLSIGCSCFPTVAVINVPSTQFLVENQTGTGNDFTDSTTYAPTNNFNTFNIFSASPISSSGPGPSPAPEPASLALMSLALIFLFAFVRIRPRIA